MSEFEYFSTVIAVILGLGVTHILGQLSFVVQHPRAVRIYWVSLTWLAIVLLSHFSAWWNIWEMRSSLNFGYHVFLYMLVGPTALFLAARLVIPLCRDEETVDLKQHYYSVNRVFFTVIGVFVAWPTVLELTTSESVSYPGIVEHGVFLVPIIACAMTTNPRIHQVSTLLVGAAFLAITLSGSVC